MPTLLNKLEEATLQALPAHSEGYQISPSIAAALAALASQIVGLLVRKCTKDDEDEDEDSIEKAANAFQNPRRAKRIKSRFKHKIRYEVRHNPKNKHLLALDFAKEIPKITFNALEQVINESSEEDRINLVLENADYSL